MNPRATGAILFCVTILSRGAVSWHRTGLEAQEPPSGAGLAPAPPSPPSPPAAVVARSAVKEGDAIEYRGPTLGPLYSDYLLKEDQTRIRTLLFLYHTTDRPNGDRSRLLLPLYYWQKQESPRDDRLYLFPLFFHRSGEEESYDHFYPFYFSRRNAESAYHLLFPLWWHTEEIARRTSIHRFLFPLGKLTFDRSSPDEAETRSRFGLPWLFELFESKVGAGFHRLSGLTFLNFRDETDGGLALFRNEWLKSPEGVEERRTFLLPLYWREETPDRNIAIAGPFYGHFAAGDSVRRYFTPLFWRGGGDGGFSSTILFPFFHRAFRQEPALSFWASYPIFHYERTASERDWGIVSIYKWSLLYSNSTRLDTGKTTHKILFPLGKIENDPDGISGHRRLLPFFIDDFNGERRWRIGFPLWWNYQNRSGREWIWDFNLVFPLYWGWGAPNDYFAFGFPLYWTSLTGSRSWELLFPLWFRRSDATSSAFYSLPLSWVNYPSQKGGSLLTGVATYRRFYGLKGDPNGWEADLLWWLWAFRSKTDESLVRLLPLFSTSRVREDRDLLLFPIYYGQWGPGGVGNYLFPIYGRYRSSDGRVARDSYAAGLYSHSTEKDESLSPDRTRNDFLWSLISFQRSERSSSVHRRALPIGYWHTESPGEDRLILAPFWYRHQIHEGDETHWLSLFLGNLFLSKSAERDPKGPAPIPLPVPAPAAAPVPGAPSSPAVAAVPAPAPGPFSPEKSAPQPLAWQQGILWPISCWGKSAEGETFEWALPFYYHDRSPTREVRSLFPLTYLKRQTGAYQVGYFRYFFLSNLERFEGGIRYSLGQLVFDWYSDRNREERRIRLLYPIFEGKKSSEGYSYQITPLCQGQKREAGGTRESSHFLFPILFRGSTALEQGGVYKTDAHYFYLFPLFGVNRKSLRTEYDALIPLFHLRTSLGSFNLQLRPFLFLRREPEETSVRIWPLHSHESGEGSGAFWIGRYLFLSKSADRQQSFSYRLDPFLVNVQTATPSSSQTSPPPLRDPWTLINYQSRTGEEGTESRWRAIPFLYGYQRPDQAASALFPLRYSRDFGAGKIDFATPWRFLFIVNQLRGAGFIHRSVLWKLFEYTSHRDRSDFHDFAILGRLIEDRKTETSRHFAVNPFYSYNRDDATGVVERRLFGFIRF